VTLAYQGEVEHRDSSGGGGVIKPGDVQWMTAGSGVFHDEFHSQSFSREGGIFEMVQLWINLPRKDKMTAPKYQSIKKDSISTVNLGEGTKLRVIAGEFREIKGPASTFTKINIYDINSTNDDDVLLRLASGTNTLIFVMRGDLKLGNKHYKEQSILIFEQGGDTINFKVSKSFKGLVLNGDPINEPVVAHGPFVMNSRDEITEAIKDFQNGKMG
jgi:quercetin 2,3-dioxygenase